MQSLASATASSLRSIRVCKAECGKIGKSGRVGETRTHQRDHSRLGSISYPRYVQRSVIRAPIEPRQWPNSRLKTLFVLRFKKKEPGQGDRGSYAETYFPNQNNSAGSAA